ncbi:hypothetical protein [Maridesulfovibrio sp.]|uniref:hypothetical protein n=1 Tax=Maridesulfovibrio sp. TaxID=2795000 RepID=UPI002A188B90|nr:hypothetical protein [Maridesulfovibrio sp.]
MTKFEKMMTVISLVITSISIVISFPSSILNTVHFQAHIADFEFEFRFLILFILEVVLGYGFAAIISLCLKKNEKLSVYFACALFMMAINAWVTFFNVEFFIVSHLTGVIAFGTRLLVGWVFSVIGIVLLCCAVGEDIKNEVARAQFISYSLFFVLFCFK